MCKGVRDKERYDTPRIQQSSPCSRGRKYRKHDETIRYFQKAATRGITGTYDLQLPSPSETSEPRGPAEAEGKRVWLAEQVELRTSSMTAPESGGRQPRIRRDLNDPLHLDPQTRWVTGELLKHTVREGTAAPGPSATGPDNLDGPVPQQPVAGTPQRLEALISQSLSCGDWRGKHHHDPNLKIGQRFVWVMVVRCGE